MAVKKKKQEHQLLYQTSFIFILPIIKFSDNMKSNILGRYITDEGKQHDCVLITPEWKFYPNLSRKWISKADKLMETRELEKLTQNLNMKIEQIHDLKEINFAWKKKKKKRIVWLMGKGITFGIEVTFFFC